MRYRYLGRSGFRVSEACLGTMTWGSQNTRMEAWAQLDEALAAGINFIDVGEMYPIPPSPELIGGTERIVGAWLHRRGRRDQLVIASKVVGQSTKLPFLRGGRARLDAANIRPAVDDILQRLRTDYLDLLQTHWPDRRVNNFGQLDYRHEPEHDGAPLLETLEVLDRLIAEGKVRSIGVSNETPWGVMTLLRLAEKHALARISSIQNPYHLLNRTLEIGLSEVIQRGDCALLAYSPLAFGVLTGKYLDGATPPGSRLSLYPQYTRYSGPRAAAITRRYVELARNAGLDPATLAIAFVRSRPFVSSVVFGATSLAQLRANISAFDVALAPDVVAQIDAIHASEPNPCP